MLWHEKYDLRFVQINVSLVVGVIALLPCLLIDSYYKSKFVKKFREDVCAKWLKREFSAYAYSFQSKPYMPIYSICLAIIILVP